MNLPIRTFRASLRQWLARVARGEAFTITYRGTPIAEVHPVGTGAKSRQAPASTVEECWTCPTCDRCVRCEGHTSECDA